MVSFLYQNENRVKGFAPKFLILFYIWQKCQINLEMAPLPKEYILYISKDELIYN